MGPLQQLARLADSPPAEPRRVDDKKKNDEESLVPAEPVPKPDVTQVVRSPAAYDKWRCPQCAEKYGFPRGWKEQRAGVPRCPQCKVEMQEVAPDEVSPLCSKEAIADAQDKLAKQMKDMDDKAFYVMKCPEHGEFDGLEPSDDKIKCPREGCDQRLARVIRVPTAKTNTEPMTEPLTEPLLRHAPRCRGRGVASPIATDPGDAASSDTGDSELDQAMTVSIDGLEPSDDDL